MTATHTPHNLNGRIRFIIRFTYCNVNARQCASAAHWQILTPNAHPRSASVNGPKGKVAAANAGQQLNVYIPESSDTGRQFLCHVQVVTGSYSRVSKGVKNVGGGRLPPVASLSAQRTSIAIALPVSILVFDTTAMNNHNNVGVVLIATNYRPPGTRWVSKPNCYITVHQTLFRR